jgi:hypothetical protein
VLHAFVGQYLELALALSSVQSIILLSFDPDNGINDDGIEDDSIGRYAGFISSPPFIRNWPSRGEFNPIGENGEGLAACEYNNPPLLTPPPGGLASDTNMKLNIK